MVAEMVKVPEHEPKAYATQPFVWTLGGILGSAMGGFLAQPATFYPSLFPADGIFGRYPYLLPNLVSVVVIVLAIVQGMLFLEETNPRNAKTAHEAVFEEDVAGDDVVDERAPLCQRSKDRRSSAHSHSCAASDRLARLSRLETIWSASVSTSCVRSRQFRSRPILQEGRGGKPSLGPRTRKPGRRALSGSTETARPARTAATTAVEFQLE